MNLSEQAYIVMADFFSRSLFFQYGFCNIFTFLLYPSLFSIQYSVVVRFSLYAFRIHSPVMMLDKIKISTRNVARFKNK